MKIKIFFATFLIILMFLMLWKSKIKEIKLEKTICGAYITWSIEMERRLEMYANYNKVKIICNIK